MPIYGQPFGASDVPALVPLAGTLEGMLSVSPALAPGVVRDRTGDRARVPLGAVLLSFALVDTGRAAPRNTVAGAVVSATVGTGSPVSLVDPHDTGTYTATVPSGVLVDGVPVVVTATATHLAGQTRTATLTLTASSRG